MYTRVGSGVLDVQVLYAISPLHNYSSNLDTPPLNLFLCPDSGKNHMERSREGIFSNQRQTAIIPAIPRMNPAD